VLPTTLEDSIFARQNEFLENLALYVNQDIIISPALNKKGRNKYEQVHLSRN